MPAHHIRVNKVWCHNICIETKKINVGLLRFNQVMGYTDVFTVQLDTIHITVLPNT